MSSSALIINFRAKIECKFSALERVNNGSFYVEVLDFGDLAICADIERSSLKGKKKLLGASMWESELAYLYRLDEDAESWIVVIDGGMAAEVFEPEGLNDFEPEGKFLQNLIISWAEDGDSPRLVGRETRLLEAAINFIEIRVAFQEYP